MKKIIKYSGRGLFAFFLLLLSVLFLIYLPPVQNYAKNKVVDYLANSRGLTLSIGHFRLAFPLELFIEQVYCGPTQTDTLVAIEKLHLKVGLKHLFQRQLSVDNFALHGVKLNWEDDTSGMKLNVDLGTIGLKANRLDLKNQQIAIQDVQLHTGAIEFVAGKTESLDTVNQTTPLAWLINVERIDLQRLNYRMLMENLPFLDVSMQHGTITRGVVDLGLQDIGVDSIHIVGVNCHLTLADRVADVQSGDEEQEETTALPWTVKAGNLQLEHSAFSMGDGQAKTIELVLSGIGIQLDSLYNRGNALKARLKDLKAVQKDGLTLTTMQADVDLDTTETSLGDGYIRTLHSWLRLGVHADTEVQHLMKQQPLAIQIEGQIGMADILPFYPDIPLEVQGQKLQINTVLSITEKRLKVGQLILEMPEHFKMTGSGSCSDYQEIEKMRGDFVVRGEMPDVTFVQSFLKETGVQVPRNMDLLARIHADQGSMTGLLRLCQGTGCLSLDATYVFQQQHYDGELVVNHFPLYRFFPGDSLGMLSTMVRFTGHGLALQEIQAEVYAYLQHFQYQGYDYKDIVLNTSLAEMRLDGSLTSKDQAIPMDLIFRADSVENEYVLDLSGRIGRVDMQALHFIEEPLAVKTGIDLRATLGRMENYSLYLKLDSLQMWDGHGRSVLGDLVLNGESDIQKTLLHLTSGDMEVEFRADTSFEAFTENCTRVAEIIQKQVEELNIDMELVRAELPPFSLQINGRQNNAITRFLKSRNVGFKQLVADIVSRKRNGIRVGIVASAPYFNQVRLDSVQLGAWQTGKSLMYSLAAGSSSEAWKGLFNIGVTGRIQGDRFRVELQQKDAQGRIGFDLGINAVLGDTANVIRLFPTNPVLGYSRWEVNQNNQLIVKPNGSLWANLRMVGQDKLIRFQSLENEGEQRDRLQVEMVGIDLSSLSQMVPFMPQLEGVLGTDLLLYTKSESVGMHGGIKVVDLGYEQQRIGTIDLNLQYLAGNRFTDHTVYAELKIDSLRRALAEGTFSTSDINRDLKLDIHIPSFPLSLVNAFMPPDVMKLGGDLIGNVYCRGTIDQPHLSGSLAFQEGTIDVVMLGTVFRLDTSRIHITDGRMLFDKYRFIAPNNSNMLLDGNIVLTPFDQMNMNLAVNARNFELVNVKKNETSLVYGKAYANIRAEMKGEFSNLNLSGNMNLLNRSDITYVLRSSDPTMVDKSIDLVRFVSFQDTTANEKDDLENQLNVSSFILRMLIEIGEQVQFGVDLSEDGNDRVTIQGGGNLVLAMNPESGMTLSGKYILTGGTVVYNVPIVGKKEFSIRNGSFVEWTSNVMNPTLNIAASSQVKTDVEEGDQTRQVVFEAIIRIQNTLNRPDITFDLSAPNDMVIQNQLATFSSEERSRQALNLLIYNTYTAPGAAKASGGSNLANNAIYSFVENELNKYTRKAGLTVGFDSHHTEENTTRTDVTYQFSKQLFNDRIRVKIGGRISTDGSEGEEGGSLQDNLVDDISIEYVLTKKRNLYVKVFRQSNYESVLDGEVTQMGAGLVWRKNFRKIKELFKNKNREEQRAKKIDTRNKDDGKEK